ncbi:Putative ribosomal protein L46 [Septoria linicola]|uniref:Large ribosomal subunit protein mL46 n=1 Tax=Septoria linicola TaxID=215465 RepID=A0A9Q9EIB9_9PEZI|nr:putative ribosomal protein L46 [Septoria linicola]USW52636.1 Putative ribosomal protein L46 [Septoria linicola]
MNAGQKSARRLASTNVLSRDNVCSSCLNRLAHPSSRRNASAAAAVAEKPSRPVEPPVTRPEARKAFRVLCSPVLSRPPQITRELTSFEKAFFLYQKRLNERLALPFTRYFYYKKGTPTDIEWKRKAKARRGVAGRDVGAYNAYAEDGWNDEVPIGSELGEPKDIVNKLIRDAEGKNITDEAVGDAQAGGAGIAGDAQQGEGIRKPVGDIVIERPAPRRTVADEKNDQKSLSRAMDRTLYLLVRDKQGTWHFPRDRIYGRENLHQAAERVLLQAAGINMNTWVVGNHPIGHHSAAFQTPEMSTVLPNKLVSTSNSPFEREEFGVKTFFMKARIMAGQADLAANAYGDKDFLWLTREEIEKTVEPQYFKSIRGMLPGR